MACSSAIDERHWLAALDQYKGKGQHVMAGEEGR